MAQRAPTEQVAPHVERRDVDPPRRVETDDLLPERLEALDPPRGEDEVVAARSELAGELRRLA